MNDAACLQQVFSAVGLGTSGLSRGVTHVVIKPDDTHIR